MKTKIYIIRKTLDMTQAEFGKLIGVSQNAISKYELGYRLMPILIAKRIIQECKNYDLTIDLNYIYEPF